MSPAPAAPQPPRPAVDPRTGRRTDGGPEPDRLALLARLQDEFAGLVPAVDPRAPVPACGDWRACELVVHLAGIHRWAAGMAVGDTSRPEDLDVPDDLGRDELAALYARHAAGLRSALASAGPDGAARTLVGDGPASFWWRRQVHETLVHLHDLHAARLGSGPAAVAAQAPDADPEVWADTVDEVVTMFQPRQVRLGRTAPLPDPVRVVATDLGWSWTLGAPEDGGGGDPAAALSATAHELALLLWGRLDLAEVRADVDAGDDGVDDADDDLVRRALAASIVP